MSAAADLQRAREEMSAARRQLLALVTRMDAEDMRRSRPGGWTAGRVLHHLIESERIYGRLLAHLRSLPQPDLAAEEPRDGADAAAALTDARAAIEALTNDIDADTLYALRRFGHEEYSALSILENIAAHDRDHLAQLRELVSPAPGGVPGPTPAAVRPARPDDLPAIVGIYNHYIVHTPVTFDLDPVTVDERRAWFGQFADNGRHRLFVAEQDGHVVGYAGAHQFRAKAAYDTTAETTIYLAPGSTGHGIGRALYAALFDALAAEDVHMLVAGITLPNDASVALHERFGFRLAGVFHEVGRKFGRYWDVGWYERELP